MTDPREELRDDILEAAKEWYFHRRAADHGYHFRNELGMIEAERRLADLVEDYESLEGGEQ